MAKKEGYTLVTCLGTGTYTDGLKGAYKETTYVFEGNREIRCFVFQDALIEFYRKELKRVIIVGTKTSSWNALLPNPTEDDKELWNDIKSDITSGGISEQNLNLLTERLNETNQGKFDFVLLTHPINLNDDTMDSILGVYSNIYPNIDKNTKLIIDITHGFRYMPMLMFQNIQYHGSEFDINDVKMVYGELGEKSIVRDVSNIWKMSEIDKQVHSFKNSFNGKDLGDTLCNYDYKMLGEWIKGFTDMIQKNYVMQIRKAIEELRVILEQIKVNANTPVFVKEVVKFLKSFCNRFNSEEVDLSYYLLVFANILNSKNLSTQAIIALKEALDTKVKEKYDPENAEKDVKELWKKDYYLTFLKNCNEYHIKNKLHLLRKERNSIAHSGYEYVNEKLEYHTLVFKNYEKAVKTAFDKVLK